jgi:hypothetical protein
MLLVVLYFDEVYFVALLGLLVDSAEYLTISSVKNKFDENSMHSLVG